MQTLYLLTLPAAFDRFGDLFTTAMRGLADAFGAGRRRSFTATTGATTCSFGAGSQDDLAVIDWQGCGIGCGMYDVAFFLGTSVTIDQRRHLERDLVDEYHDIVCRMGARNHTREDCRRSYRRNILGTLMPMVIGCGGLDMSDPKLVDQTRERTYPKRG